MDNPHEQKIAAGLSEPTQQKASVVPFVDGPTRRLRAEATRRVEAAGIFSVGARMGGEDDA